MTEYGYAIEVPEGYDEAVVRIRLALRGEGFSILTEAHVGGMLGEAAGSERQYLIMGAFNVASAPRSIDPGLQVAVHVPCNVVVQEQGASALVAAADPVDQVEGADAAAMELALQARTALGRAFDRVTAPPP